MTASYTPEQQAEHRQIFADALESGKYRQCQGMLTLLIDADHPHELHCCLGVATEEAIIAGVQLEREDIDGRVWYKWGLAGSALDQQVDLLPEPVRHWLGFATIDGHLRTAITIRVSDEDTVATTLVDLNDDHGWTFEDIARLVREDKIALEGDTVNG